MKIALYKSPGGTCEYVTEWDDFEEESNHYIRTSEIVDVEFVDLPPEEVVPQEIKAIDKSIEEARAKFQASVDIMEERKAKLLAITQQ